MVVRRDLLEDLIHLLQVTHWPNDKNLSFSRGGANRVPKPPRTPSSTPTPTFQGEITTTQAALGDREADKHASSDNVSCFKELNGSFDLESLICSLEPKYSIEVQSQYEHIDPLVAAVEHQRSKQVSSKSVSSSIAHEGSHYRSTASTENGLASQTLSKASSTALQTSESLPRPNLLRQLSTKTQQVLKLLLADVFEINEEDMIILFQASQGRKVSLNSKYFIIKSN